MTGLVAALAGTYYLLLAVISAKFLVTPAGGMLAAADWFWIKGNPVWTLAVVLLAIGIALPAGLLWRHAVRVFRGPTSIDGPVWAVVAIALLSILAAVVNLTSDNTSRPTIGSGAVGFVVTGIVFSLPALASLALAVASRRSANGAAE